MDDFIAVCKVVLPVILGSAVVAELVKLVADVINNRYNKKIDYASDCVKEADKKIKELIICIKRCSYKELKEGSLDTFLYELQSCLDVSGYTRKYDYNSDGHAWKDIERLCKSKDEDEFTANKELLLMDLVLIQQYHKDNIKKDIHGKRFNVPLFISSLFVIIFHTICFFVSFELSDILLYVCEVLIVLLTILYMPGVLWDSAFEARYYERYTRKRENLHKACKCKKQEIVLSVVVSVMSVIVGICAVFLLQLDNMPKENVKAISDAAGSQSFWETIMQGLRDKKVLIFWIFSGTYIVLGLINIFYIWQQKVDKFFYVETVRKLRIEKNKFYVQEIKELMDNAKRQMIKDDKVKYSLVCDKMLVLAYVKLSDLKEYCITEKGKRISSMESREDVEKEMRFCENEDKINEALKRFREIGKTKISLTIKKKELKKKRGRSFANKVEKKVRLITDKIQEICENLDEIDLNSD